MVAKKPDRRKKVEKDPVTIDLSAKDSSPVAEPVRSNDADKPTPRPDNPAKKNVPANNEASAKKDNETAAMPEKNVAAKVTAKNGNTASDKPSEPAPTPPAKEASSDKTSLGEKPSLGEKSGTASTASAASDQRSQSPKSGIPNSGIPKSSTQQSSAPKTSASTSSAPKTSTPKTSTMIASGIFGGIVALLLAGAAQYAGYLPGMTPPPAIETSSDTGLSFELEELRQEVAALKDQPAAAPDTKLADRVAALEAASETPAGVSDKALSDLEAALRKEISGLRSTLQSAQSAQSSTAETVKQLEERLAAAEAKLNDSGPEEQVARALGAAALKAAIDRGGSFESELQTFASVAADDPAVADLQPFATKGVPARDDLQQGFSRIADRMLEAAAQPEPDQGIAGRLLSSALSAVKVRRTGDVEGDTPEAIVARIEEGLRSGNLQAAARQWETLPQEAKSVSTEFKQKLDARIRVEDLVSGTLTRAVASTKN